MQSLRSNNTYNHHFPLPFPSTKLYTNVISSRHLSLPLYLLTLRLPVQESIVVLFKRLIRDAAVPYYPPIPRNVEMGPAVIGYR